MNDLRASHRVGQDGTASAAAPKTSSFPLASLCLQTFVGVVLACAILLSVADLFSIGFFFERNYNEGWNVYNAQRLVDGQNIYDDNYWRVNNYPIISFMIVAGVNFLVDNLLLSGRIVALVSF